MHSDGMREGEMEKVRLGNSEFYVTRLCFGTGTLTRRGEELAEAAESVIRDALDTGCNFVDTAPTYGSSEQAVGRAIAGRRREVIVATKLVQCPADEVAPRLEASLHNLGTDYIDLYICHWPDSRVPLEPFLEELARQREAGKIRAIGVSNFNLAQMKTALEYGVISLQPPFSILWRFPDGVREFCRQHGIAITTYSPLAQGLLTGRYTRGGEPVTGWQASSVLSAEEHWPHTKRVIEQLDEVADRLGCTSSQAALAWVLRTPGITVAIVQTSAPGQWREDLDALDIAMPDEDYEALDRAGKAVWQRFEPELSMWGFKPE